MVNTHIAHDCIIGNNCVIANNATLAGHVHIGNNVVLGGLCAIHQKVKVGDGAMLGGMSGLGEDLIPYGMSYAKNGRKRPACVVNYPMTCGEGSKEKEYDTTDQRPCGVRTPL